MNGQEKEKIHFVIDGYGVELADADSVAIFRARIANSGAVGEALSKRAACYGEKR
jgi:hypothetical protein